MGLTLNSNCFIVKYICGSVNTYIVKPWDLACIHNAVLSAGITGPRHASLAVTGTTTSYM